MPRQARIKQRQNDNQHNRGSNILAFQAGIISDAPECMGKDECTWAVRQGIFELKFVNRLCPTHGYLLP